MSLIGKGPAPAPGQASNNCSYPSPSTALVTTTRTAIVINVPSTAPTHADARIRDRYVQYTSDPRVDAGTQGLWRTYGAQPRERISPFAIRRISVGQRGGIEIEVVHPKTGIHLEFGGSLDTIASDLHRAGQRRGVRGDRQGIYWALREFCNLARRQAAARGVQV